MELNATFGIRYGHFSSVDGGGGGGGGHDSLRDKAEIFWQMMVAVRGGEIMTWLYCTSVHHQKDQSHKSIMFSTPVITTSAHKHWLSLPIQWADERRMQMLEMRRLRSARTMFPYSRLRRYLLSIAALCNVWGQDLYGKLFCSGPEKYWCWWNKFEYWSYLGQWVVNSPTVTDWFYSDLEGICNFISDPC